MYLLRGNMVFHQVRKLNFETIAQGHPNAGSAFFLMQKFLFEDGNKNICATCKIAIVEKYVYQME